MSRATRRNNSSVTKPALSPVSSQSAAAAEAETIRRLRREVLGLTLAVDTLKKNSNEWEFLNSKLEVAREELDAVLEDDQLFRSISSSGSGKKASFTTRSIPEEQCNELLHMIPTPPLTPTTPIDKTVEQLEEKLSQQVKYSLEWFETKRRIDAKTKKCESVTVNGSPNKKYVRSSSTGSILTPIRREKLKKLPSTGASVSETQRPTVMTSIRDSQSIQCLEDRLDHTTKYSLEWFELKRVIYRRSNKDPKLKTVKRRKSNGAELMKENSSSKVVGTRDKKDADRHQSRRKTLERPDSTNSSSRSHSEDADLKPPDVSDEHVLSSLSISASSSAPNANLQPEPQEKANTGLSISVIDHNSRTSDELGSDLFVANCEIKQDPNAIQKIQRLQDFLERVPKYSREYYQTKKIIRLMQTNN
mmetsp:Transcript_19364/g.29230  ORF Transcript_19364/g.29230 Transcript_19364/m.29230 type:complete len:418 (-) Transcript_19364:103-1356(-)